LAFLSFLKYLPQRGSGGISNPQLGHLISLQPFISGQRWQAACASPSLNL